MNDCPLNFDELPWQHNQQFYTDLEVNFLNVNCEPIFKSKCHKKLSLQTPR